MKQALKIVLLIAAIVGAAFAAAALMGNISRKCRRTYMVVD